MNQQLKHSFFAVLFLVSQLGIAQDNILLIGKVIAGTLNEPLGMAAVMIKGTQLGTLTEDNGCFNLPIPKLNLKDSLRVSFVGFDATAVSIRDYKNGDTIHITLGSGSFTKLEVEVKALSAKGVLLRAIDSLKRNLYRDSLIQQCFYRQYHKENGKYVRLIEADVNIAYNVKDKFRYSFHELIYSNVMRRAENYENNGDQHGDHLVDLLKENPFSYQGNSFLNAKNVSLYNPKFGPQETDAVFHIVLQYSQVRNDRIENIELFINKETYAITEISVSKFPNPNFVKSRYANDTRWKLINENVTIRMHEVGGRQFVGSIERVYNHHVLNRATGEVQFIVEEAFDLFPYKSITHKVAETMGSKPYVSNTNFYSQSYKYDAKWWSNYAPLDEHKIKPEVVTDLEHGKKIETQFIEAGK